MFATGEVTLAKRQLGAIGQRESPGDLEARPRISSELAFAG